MVGIGGISMSALAILLKKSGCNVIGSDRVKTRLTKKLKDYDIKVFYSSRAHYLKGVSLVVFSGAISKDHPQLVYAKQKGIKAIERSVLLAEISKRYSTVIAVSGTHGKTTTTAMLGYIFLLAGLNPTVHVGAECECFNGNLYYGNNNFSLRVVAANRPEGSKPKVVFSALDQQLFDDIAVLNDHSAFFSVNL